MLTFTCKIKRFQINMSNLIYHLKECSVVLLPHIVSVIFIKWCLIKTGRTLLFWLRVLYVHSKPKTFDLHIIVLNTLKMMLENRIFFIIISSFHFVHYILQAQWTFLEESDPPLKMANIFLVKNIRILKLEICLKIGNF